MDNKERVDSLLVAVQSAMDNVQPSVWTAMPGIVQSVDASKGTCSVQPAIQMQMTDKTGKKTWASLPMLVDVPLQYLGGGGFLLTMPVAAGDEGLIVFACRCIDSWWQQGGVQKQAEMRMHDLSDGFFFPGFRSQAHKIANVSTTNAQLRSTDGTSTLIDLAPAGIRVVSTTQVTIDAPTILLKGAITIQGTVSGSAGTVNFGGSIIQTTGNMVAGNLISGGKSFNGHVHPVMAVGANTGGPV